MIHVTIRRDWRVVCPAMHWFGVNTVLIRRAVTADVESIALVGVDTSRVAYSGIIPVDYLSSLSYHESAQLWRERLFSSGNDFRFAVVAEEFAGDIAGFAAGGTVREADADYNCEIYALYVLTHYQRQGIGRQLVLSAGRIFLDHNLNSVLIWVLAVNLARVFYESLGGTLVRQREIVVGTANCLEVAYGWPDVETLLKDPKRNGIREGYD
jgi:GNAT superfamily N-acetyltransferase